MQSPILHIQRWNEGKNYWFPSGKNIQKIGSFNPVSFILCYVFAYLCSVLVLELLTDNKIIAFFNIKIISDEKTHHCREKSVIVCLGFVGFAFSGLKH